jgi:hypothetical protein
VDFAEVVHLFIELVLIGLLFWLVWWFIGYCNPPEPFNKVLRVLVGLVAIVFLAYIIIRVMNDLGPIPHFNHHHLGG